MAAPHPWKLTPAEAIALQNELRHRVRLEPLTAPVHRLAAVDMGFADGGATARAAAVLFRWPGLELIDAQLAYAPTPFPYIPGLLSFRELPVVLQALERLPERPDLVLCDGQGIAHPRRLGIAAHLGVVADLPTIGIGKTRLTGRFEEPGPERGDWTALSDRGERIGSVLRTRRGVKPLFVSPGHRVTHEQAIEWVLATLGRYRLPEPIRLADRLASARGKRASEQVGDDDRGGAEQQAGQGG